MPTSLAGLCRRSLSCLALLRSLPEARRLFRDFPPTRGRCLWGVIGLRLRLRLRGIDRIKAS